MALTQLTTWWASDLQDVRREIICWMFGDDGAASYLIGISYLAFL
jgi:hypothetical protein